MGYVPDSLKKAFKTRSGRTVYDGGGITPDIEVEPKYYSRPVISLIYSNVISDYAIKYYNTHDSIAPAGEFLLTDEEYADFVRFAAQKEFDARTESQILDGLKEEMDGLLERISLTKEDFLEANKSTVKSLLEDEIALKFYLRAGGAESALRQDSQLQQALEQWDGTIPVQQSDPETEEQVG